MDNLNVYFANQSVSVRIQVLVQFSLYSHYMTRICALVLSILAVCFEVFFSAKLLGCSVF